MDYSTELLQKSELSGGIESDPLSDPQSELNGSWDWDRIGGTGAGAGARGLANAPPKTVRLRPLAAARWGAAANCGGRGTCPAWHPERCVSPRGGELQSFEKPNAKIL